MNETSKTPNVPEVPEQIANAYNELFDLIVNNPNDTIKIKEKISELSIMTGITDTYLNQLKSFINRQNIKQSRNKKDWTKEELVDLFKIIEYGGKDKEHTISLINEKFNLGIPKTKSITKQNPTEFFLTIGQYVYPGLAVIGLYILFKVATWFSYIRYLWQRYILKPIHKYLRPDDEIPRFFGDPYIVMTPQYPQYFNLGQLANIKVPLAPAYGPQPKEPPPLKEPSPIRVAPYLPVKQPAHGP